MKSVRAKPELLRLPLRGRAPTPTPSRRWLARAEWIAAALVSVSMLAPMPLAARALAALAVLAMLGIALAIRARASDPTLTAWIVLDADGIARERAGVVTRFSEWGGQFGVAALSNEARDLGLLAFTSKAATRYVPVRVMDGDDRSFARDLFAHPAALTEGDVRLAARDDQGALSAEDASRLVSAVRARDPMALDRIVLSDPRGALVVLEGDSLRAGDRVIDLAAPLEWRAFSFVEQAGAVASMVQATWVRQAGVEVVLVADAGREPSQARGARVSSPDAAPPPELRIAIERLFMAPLRHALDRAPRLSRAPAPTAAAQHRAPT